jgi:hypothetical protein
MTNIKEIKQLIINNIQDMLEENGWEEESNGLKTSEFFTIEKTAFIFNYDYICDHCGTDIVNEVICDALDVRVSDATVTSDIDFIEVAR